jgi:Tfp pilus assembly PilM family ATPase
MFINNMLAVDWDRNHIRLLEFSKDRKGTVGILHAIFEPIPEESAVDNADALGGFIKQTIQKHGIRPASAIFMVGREKAFLHQLTIPASPEGEVANLVRFQLAQELPFAIEESVVDYVVTAKNEKGLVIGVLAAAVPNDHIDFLQKTARASGLTIRRIGLRPYGNFLSAKGSGYLDEGLNLFVDLNLHEIEIDILSAEGGIVFSRSAGLGPEQPKTSPVKNAYLEQVFLHLKRTLQAQTYLTASPESRIHKILVAGSTGWEQDFLNQVAEDMKIPGDVFHIPNYEPAGETESPAYVAAYGMAIAQTQKRQDVFDFLFPKKAIDPQAVKARQIRMGIMTAAFVLLLAFVYTQRLVSQKTEDLARLVAQKKQLDKELTPFKKFLVQTDAIHEWENRRVDWLGEFSMLNDLLPSTEQAYVKHIFVSESPKGKEEYHAMISIEGQASSRQVIDQLSQRLADTGRYEVTPGQQISGTRDPKFPENFKLDLKVIKKKAKDLAVCPNDSKKETKEEKISTAQKQTVPAAGKKSPGESETISEKVKRLREKRQSSEKTAGGRTQR